jgi:hypothetical protein
MRCDRVRRVFAVRELVDQFLEGGEGFAGRLRVALGRILGVDEAQEADLVVEVDQAAQVVHIVDLRVVRVQLDEAFHGCQRLGLVLRFVVRIGNFHLRLGGVGAERIVGFEAFEQLDRGFVVTARHFLLRVSV